MQENKERKNKQVWQHIFASLLNQIVWSLHCTRAGLFCIGY
jgi:hypothetical protein